MGVTTYTYDAAGNMTYDGVHHYTYDAEGNITAVDGGSTATYTYDALNHRVRSVANGATTEYVFNAAGQRVSEWNGATRAQLKGKYYWGAKPVAYYTVGTGGATHFEHSDTLGTEHLRTTYTGAVEGSYTSLPFGDGYAATGTDADANHYATLDHDSETDTDHAQFRQYENTQGRWLSPDPYSGSYDLTNPQSMNRYVYALNNPLSLVDWNGLDPGTVCVYNSSWSEENCGVNTSPCNPNIMGGASGSYSGQNCDGVNSNTTPVNDGTGIPTSYFLDGVLADHSMVLAALNTSAGNGSLILTGMFGSNGLVLQNGQWTVPSSFAPDPTTNSSNDTAMCTGGSSSSDGSVAAFRLGGIHARGAEQPSSGGSSGGTNMCSVGGPSNVALNSLWYKLGATGACIAGGDQSHINTPLDPPYLGPRRDPQDPGMGTGNGTPSESPVLEFLLVNVPQVISCIKDAWQ